MGTDCGCGSSLPIYACSGASDTGAITDLTARRLTLEGRGKLSCLAQIGAHIDTAVENARKAGKVLALDGCPIDCARKTLEQHGITGFQHLRVTDLGLKKGQSPANAQNVGVFHQAALQILEKPGETQGACCG